MVAVDRYSYTPYIFSEEEMRVIFSACDQYPVAKESPSRHLVLALIIRMLYGCGLRVSEATDLTISDVDLKEGALYIRNTKFGKERLLPMADSLTKRCREYRELVLMGKSDKAYIFPSPFGGHYSSNTIYDLFRKIMWSAGISHTGKGPRLHDLRHYVEC
jgi:integrase/recombinase XerD